MNDHRSRQTSLPDHAGIFDVAAEQAGYFTTEQAHGQGFSSALLTHHVKRGKFIRVSRGVYRIRDYPSAPREELVAAWLRLAPDAAVSHESALEVFGLSDLIPDAIHISVPRTRRRLARQPGVRIHTSAKPLSGDQVTIRGGVRVTSPARSIIDAAEAGAFPDQIQAAIRQAIERRLTTPEALHIAGSGASARVSSLVQLAIPGPAAARYATAQAFQHSLEARLHAISRETGRTVGRLRKEVVFARFLARLAQEAPDRWVLKGGLALDYRFGDRARSTRDVDLAMTGAEIGATRDLMGAAKLELGDFFIFSLERTADQDQDEDGAAVRYHVRSELAGRVFDEFIVDVGFDYPERADIDLVRGRDLTAFAGLPAMDTPTIGIERQLAEKAHAYTRTYGIAKARTTRVKDLVDIGLIARSAVVDARHLRLALEETFAGRARQALPVTLPEPPSEWRLPFAKLARELSLSASLGAGFDLAAAFLDPILGDPGFRATWNPATGAWEPKDARR